MENNAVFNEIDFISNLAKLVSPKSRNDSISYDILENENRLLIYAETPGIVNKHDVLIEIYSNKLKIITKKCPEYNISDYTSKHIGIDYSDKEVTIELPTTVSNSDNVKTQLNDGVLKIVIEKEPIVKISVSPD